MIKALLLAVAGCIALTAAPALAAPHHDRHRHVVVKREVVRHVVVKKKHHPVRHSYARPLTDKYGHVHLVFVW